MLECKFARRLNPAGFFVCEPPHGKPGRHPAHSLQINGAQRHVFGGEQIVIFLLAGAAACPFAFTHLWERKWFRVLWWIAIAMTIAGFLIPGG
jgi:hypothetical protein